MTDDQQRQIIFPASITIAGLAFSAFLTWTAWSAEHGEFYEAGDGSTARTQITTEGIAALGEMLGFWGSLGLSTFVVVACAVWMVSTVRRVRAMKA